MVSGFWQKASHQDEQSMHLEKVETFILQMIIAVFVAYYALCCLFEVLEFSVKARMVR